MDCEVPGPRRGGGVAKRLLDTLGRSRRKEAAPAAAPARAEEGGAPEDPAGALARSQSADGSFGGDVARTAAALLTLVLLGHTRRRGLRRRAVTKAAAWLSARAGDARAALALAALASAEGGRPPSPEEDWRVLTGAGVEGGYLAALLRRQKIQPAAP